MGRRKRLTDGSVNSVRPRDQGVIADRAFRLPTTALWAIIGAGFALRLLLACTTWGTVDTMSYLKFAHRIEDLGLYEAYRGDPGYNHPPVPALLSYVALEAAGGSGFGFAVIYRIPIVLADFASAMLLWRIAVRRGAGSHAGLALAALYAWNPCAILVSGYHFNTDPVVAMLSLLALYLYQDRERPLLAGLVLGAAINVKLIPVLLIPALCLRLRPGRPLIQFLVGLAVMSVPYLVPLVSEPVFARNVLAYKSQPDPWGVLLFLRWLHPAGIDPLGEIVDPSHPAAVYNRWGSWIILGCAVAWAVLARRLGSRFDAYRVAAVIYALFLVLAPGFGVQYLVLIAPLLYIAGSRRLAQIYGLAAGAFQLAAYYYFWDGEFPISSLFNRAFPNELAVFGLAPWVVLVYFLLAVAPKPTADARYTMPS